MRGGKSSLSRLEIRAGLAPPDGWMARAPGLAEGVGFEPTDGCPSPVFKTGAIDHSATLPLDAMLLREPG